MFTSIKKKQVRRGWKARVESRFPLLPVRGRRTLSALGGGTGGCLCPGQHRGV